MDTVNGRSISIIVRLAAWGIIPLAFLSWCFSTVSYKSGIYMYLAGAIGAIAGIIYHSLYVYCEKKENTYKEQLDSINATIITAGLLFVIIISSDYQRRERWCIYAAAFIWILPALISFFRHRFWFWKEKVSDDIRNHSLLLLLMLISLILSLDENVYQFKWDGLLYYIAVRDSSISSISSLALYGHNAMGSGAFFRLFCALVHDTGWGMIIANRVVYIIAVGSFYGILKNVSTDKKQIEYTLGTACFAFSPFLLGMIGYFSTDWFSVCISVILLYYIIKHQWILTTVWGCIFCLTKEPSLIAYSGICLGLVIVDMIDYGLSVKGLKRILLTLHYYFLLIPYLLWYSSYRILGRWSAGGGEFSINAIYIVRKLKGFMIMNFNWLILLMIICCVIFLHQQKRLREQISWIFPILFSNCALLAFNILYKTVNHPRYIDSFISYNLVLAVGLVSISMNKQARKVGTMTIIAAVFLISCYLCIDPVTKVFFTSNNIGNSSLISTDELKYGDSSIYNKQMLWMEQPVSEAISDALSEGTAIVFAVSDNSIYSFDGMSEKIGLSSAIDKDVQYWDKVKRKRIPFASESIARAIPYVIYHVADGTPVDDIDCENQSISVIYIDGINDYTMSSGYVLDNTIKYSYRNWVICRDVIKPAME